MRVRACVSVETLPNNVVEPSQEFDPWERSSNAYPYLARSDVAHNNLTGSIPASIGLGPAIDEPHLKFLWVQGSSVALSARGFLRGFVNPFVFACGHRLMLLRSMRFRMCKCA